MNVPLQPGAALHEAAIGEHRCRGDVARAVAGQQRDHAGDLLRLRHSPQRYGRVQLRHLGRIVHRRKVDGRGDSSGAHADDEDVVRASSTPAVRVSMRMPPLDRQYAVLPGIGQSSCTEVMLMMRPPPPCLIICLAASCVPKNALFRLIASTLSYCSSVVSSTEVRVSMPALFTMMSSRPNASHGGVDQPLQVGDLADVRVHADGLIAERATCFSSSSVASGWDT